MPCNRKSSQRGSALIFAIIAIGILTAIVSASMQRATTDTSLSASWNRRSRTFEIADTGIQLVARKVLDTYNTSGSFNSFLGTIQMGNSGGGQYSVIVVDNSNVGGVDQDGDGSNNTDRDQVFRLVSTGVVGDVQQVIEALFKITAGSAPITWPPSPTGCPSPPCNSAALLCGAGNVSQSGSSTISGSDFPYPPYGCNGSHCNVTAISGSTGYGVIGDSTISTSGTVTNLASQGASAGCAGWQSLYDQVVNLSPSAPDVVLINGSSYSTSNDCAHPKVFLIDTASTTVSFASNIYLCGTFIFKSNTTIQTAGTSSLIGAFLMMGNYSTNAFAPSTGTSNIFGRIIIRSTAADAQIEVATQGNGGMRYSTAGMDAALEALNAANAGSGSGSNSLETVSWRNYGN